MEMEMLQKNEADFIAALTEQFGEGAVEVHTDPVELQMWNGTSALVKNAYGTAPKCHIVVRRKAIEKALGRHCATNDLGFKRREDGKYDAHLDLAGFDKVSQDKVAQDYAVRVASRKLKAQGYTLKREKMQDGRVKLVAQKYG
jgi:hypothetical protein